MGSMLTSSPVSPGRRFDPVTNPHYLLKPTLLEQAGGGI
jgi:hypothetical protein